MKKFLKYIITLVIVFAISMGATIMMLQPNTGNNKLGASNVADGSGGSPAMAKLMQYFQTLHSFEVSGKICFDGEESKKEDGSVSLVSSSSLEEKNALQFYVKADISSLTNSKVYAKLDYCYNSNSFSSQITYLDGTLFVEAQGTGIKVESASLNEAMGAILASLNVGELDTSKLLEQFNISQIMVALGQMKEQENPNGTITNTLKLPKLATVDIITDNEYELKSLNIYDIEIIETKASLNVAIEKTEECNLSEPENANDYFNITKWTNAAKRTLSLNEISVSPVLTFNLANGNSFEAKIKTSKTANGSVFANVDIMQGGLVANLYILNGRVYAGINNAKISVSASSIKEVLETISKQMGAGIGEASEIAGELENAITSTVENSNFASILQEKIKNLNVSELVASIATFDLDASTINIKVDLSKISALNSKATAEMQLAINEEREFVELANLSVCDGRDNDFNLKVCVEDTACNLPEINSAEYIDLNEVVAKLASIKNITGGTVRVNANVVANGISQNAMMELVCNSQNQCGSLSAKLAGKLNLEANLTFAGNELFASAEGVNLLFNNEFIKNALNVANGISYKEIVNAMSIASLNGEFENLQGKYGEAFNAINKIAEMLKDLSFEGNTDEILNAIIKSVSSGEAKDELSNLDFEKIYNIASDVYEVLKTITTTSNSLTFKIEAGKFGFTSTVTFCFEFNDEGFVLNILNFNRENLKLNLTLEFNANKQDVEAVNKADYLDIYAVAQNLYALKDVREGEFSINANVTENGKTTQNFNISGSLRLNDLNNILGNVTLGISGTQSVNANLIYINNVAYLKCGGLNVKLNLNQANDVLKAFGENRTLNEIIDDLNSDSKDNQEDTSIFTKLQNMGIDTQELETLVDRLKAITLEDFARNFKSVKTNAGTIEIVIDKELLKGAEDLVVTINLKNNKVYEIVVSNFAISENKAINLQINFEDKKIEEPEVCESEYVDLAELALNTVSMKDFENLNLGIVATVFEGNSGIYELIADVKLKLTDGKFNGLSNKVINLLNSGYVNISAVLGGREEFDAQVVLKDGEIYVHVANNFIKIGKLDLYSLIGISEEGVNNLIEENVKLPEITGSSTTQNLTIASILNLISKFSVQSNSNLIKLELDGSLLGQEGKINLEIVLKDNAISSIEIKNLKIAENKTINAKLTLDAKTEVKETVPAGDYFDLVDGYNGLLDMLSLKQVAVDIKAGIFDASNQDKALDFGETKTGKYEQSFDVLLEKISNPDAKTLDLFAAIQTFGLENNLDLDVYYEGDVLYVSYLSELGNAPLKMKISKDNINASVLAICDLLFTGDNKAEQIEAVEKALDAGQNFMQGAGIETIIDLNKLSLINIFGKAKDEAKEQANTNSGINISEILGIIKGITISSNHISLNLPASVVGTSSPICVDLNFINGILNHADVFGLDCNLFAESVAGLGINLAGKKLDLSLNVSANCNSVTKVDDANSFMNLNGVDEILQSATNAINNNKGFTLNGKINAGFTTSSGKKVNLTDVQVNVTANMGENGLELLIDLPKIPVVFPGIVFKTASSGRSSQIYYCDGMVYINRFDDFIINSKDKRYKYSCTLDWCFANIADVLGYAMGFTNLIVREIRDSINSTDTKAPNKVIENILKSFSANTSGTTSNYDLTIDGSALAQNTMIGDLALKIKTNNSVHKIDQIGIDMVFVKMISLNGMLNFTAHENPVTINYDTSGHTFQG